MAPTPKPPLILPMAARPQATVFPALDRLAGALPALGVAVSGGGDSLALLYLAVDWAKPRGMRIEAATVDHRLRAESQAEADSVSQTCAALGIPHRVLRWAHDGEVRGNLMAAARDARLGLLGAWARDRGLPAVALGHTMDDQAETLLMRLARGAGVDGLSGMAEARDHGGTLWLRPLLGVRREALRADLALRGVAWIDDPTNDDTGFDRIRARQTIAALDLPVQALAQSAAHLADARAALAESALSAAAGFRADHGTLRLPAAVLDAPPELLRRLTLAALRWITGAPYGPRGADLARLIAALRAGDQATLDGVIARADAGPEGAWIAFLREPAAARDVTLATAPTAFWDNRWRLENLAPGAVIRAPTPADLTARDWRATGLPRTAILSAPVVQTGPATVFPLLDAGAPVTATPLRQATDFARIIRAH